MGGACVHAPRTRACAHTQGMDDVAPKLLHSSATHFTPFTPSHLSHRRTSTPPHLHTFFTPSHIFHLQIYTPSHFTPPHLHTSRPFTPLTPSRLQPCTLHTCAPRHLHTSTPPHLNTSTPPHLHTSTPPHSRTVTPSHLHTVYERPARNTGVVLLARTSTCSPEY